MEGQRLKITLLVLKKKVVKMGGGGRRGRGKGHASKSSCEYKWKKESVLLDVRAHLLLWHCRYTYFYPKLCSISLDIC